MYMKIYNMLLSYYGSQGWWPVSPEGKTKPEYSGGPKTRKQQLEVMFGAILTQNTTWSNAEKAIIKLNESGMINVDKIIKADAKTLAGLIRQSGYFNQKAAKLKSLCFFLKKYPLQDLEKMPIKKLRPLLLSVKGIGPETADSIILYAFNKPVFVIDAYTKRLFTRLGLIKRAGPKQNTKKNTGNIALPKMHGYDYFQHIFHKSLEKDTKVFQEYHALIVEHSKNICKKKPICKSCFLAGICKSSQNIWKGKTQD